MNRYHDRKVSPLVAFVVALWGAFCFLVARFFAGL